MTDKNHNPSWRSMIVSFNIVPAWVGISVDPKYLGLAIAKESEITKGFLSVQSDKAR